MKKLLSKTPTTREIRVFLAIWAGIFAVFLAFGLAGRGEMRLWAACGVGVSLALMLLPRLALPFYRVWLVFGECVGFCVSRTILAVLFFGLFTPLSLIFRAFGRDILGTKIAFKSKSESFFKPRENQPQSMKNQF